jgi:hypothetical protein
MQICYNRPITEMSCLQKYEDGNTVVRVMNFRVTNQKQITEPADYLVPTL